MKQAIELRYKYAGVPVTLWADCVDVKGLGRFYLDSLEVDSSLLFGDGHGEEHPYRQANKLFVELDRLIESKGLPLKPLRFRIQQIKDGLKVAQLISTHGWAMLRHMPRTGKTLTALYGLECLPTGRVLIITTKNAVRGIGGKRAKAEGWIGAIEDFKSAGFGRHEYIVTTPHQVHKVADEEFDYCIVDESHKIYSEPKPTASALWAQARRAIGNARVIFCTATPHAQSVNQLYWQLMLCRYNPFLASGLDSFNKFFDAYGKPYVMILGNGVTVPRYDRGDEEAVYKLIGYGILSLTQVEAGMDADMLPVDEVHYVELTGVDLRMWKEYATKEQMEVNGVMIHTMNSRDVPIRLHQIEGGTLKYVDVFSITDENTGIRIRGLKAPTHNWLLPSMDRVKYIKAIWGDKPNVVIMYHYVNEGKLLRREFKHAKILQGKTNAEGIDLWMYDHMIIYSMDWSVATYIQRRDRQVHMTKRDKPIRVHYLVTKGGISEDVYKSVVEKGEDLTFKYYEKKPKLAVLGGNDVKMGRE